jgi:hypothetical protein
MQQRQAAQQEAPAAAGTSQASIIKQATSSIVMHLRDHDDDSILHAIQSLTTIYDSISISLYTSTSVHHQHVTISTLRSFVCIPILTGPPQR